MDMEEIRKANYRLDYSHYVTYNGKEYIREETLMPQSYAWESEPDKLLDLHTISWRPLDEEDYQINGDIEYFSGDKGWAKDNILDKSNPVPEIEKHFKETIGRDLIYFK